MTQQRDSKVKKGERANQQGRKPYLKPQLIEYGNMEKMTQRGTGGTGDFRNFRSGVRGS